MTTINARKDAQVSKMADKAADLSKLLEYVYLSTDLEEKRNLACLMADHFKVGGKEKFLQSIRSAPNAQAIDRIATNATLKGEGMSTKRF